jgi:acetyl-CoA carboxylase biotin carboxyl carrier protein
MSIEVRSPAVGRVLEVLVAVGESVAQGAELLILESMKMEIPVPAPGQGTVREIKVAAGAQVRADEVVALIEIAERANRA